MLDPESMTDHIEIGELARSEVEEAAWMLVRAMGTNPGLVAVFGPPEQKALRPREPHWHLGPIAVLPERQGQGIGTRLLRRFCEEVDRAGDGAYLETDKPENVRLYQRFSFTVTARQTLFGVVTWIMWRARCPARLDAHP